MTVPPDVQREVEALQVAINDLIHGRWESRENTAGGKLLRGAAKQIVHSAKKVEESVRANTYAPR